MCVCVCGWGGGGGGGQDIVGFVDEVALWLLDVAHVKAHVGVNTTHTTCIRTAPVLSQRAPVEHVAFCMLLSACTQVSLLACFQHSLPDGAANCVKQSSGFSEKPYRFRRFTPYVLYGKKIF